MKQSVYFLVICAIFYTSAANDSPDNVDTAPQTLPQNGFLGFGLELLLTKLDIIDRKLFELQSGQYELQKQISTIKASQEKTNGDFSVLQNQSLLILEQQTAFISKVQSYEKVLKSISEQNQATTSTSTTSRTITPKPKQPPFSSCKDVPYNVSGVYLIRVNNDSTPFKVFCEQEKFGGGWIVVQHRFNGSVDFYRTWAEYREGFGNLENEFWLGLEKMHQITTARVHEIIFEIKDFQGNYGYARYDGFKIGSESEHYSLNTLGMFSGTAGNAILRNKGRKFSTKDRKNYPLDQMDCLEWCKGAWWHKDCTDASLNGPYKDVTNGGAMFWIPFKNYRGLSFARMMIREL